VWRNEEALATALIPSTRNAALLRLLKTQALLDALRAHALMRFGGARDEESRAPRSASSPFATVPAVGSKEPAPELWSCSTAHRSGRKHSRLPALQLDGAGIWHYIHLEKIPIVRSILPKSRMLVRTDSLIPVEQPFVKDCRRRAMVKCACAPGMQSMHRRDSLRGRHRSKIIRTDACATQSAPTRH